MGGCEFGWHSAGNVPMFSENVTPNGVVSSEGARTIMAFDTDALMPLSNVSSEIRLITVGTLTKRAFELLAGARDGVPIVRVANRLSQSHQITG